MENIVKETDNFRLFILIITLHGFLLSTLMAIGQLFVDKKSSKNLLYFGLFVDFAFFEINALFFETGIIKKYFLLHQLSIPALYLLGPLLFLFSKFSVDKTFQFKKSHLLHLVPLMISIGAVFFGVTFYPPKVTTYLDGYFYNSITMIVGFGGSVLLFFYIAFIWQLLFSNSILKAEVLRKEPSVSITLFLVLLVSIAWITDLLSVLFNDIFFIEISILILSFMIIFLFLVNFSYPEFYRYLRAVVETEKEKRSYISGLDLYKLCLDLNTLMSEKEPFVDEDLNLTKLADRLNLSAHQLSQFINYKFKKNFSSYINEFRIEKAKKLLLEEKNANILNIAFDVGFKSKSTFNSVFLKHTGIPPSEFRKKNIY